MVIKNSFKNLRKKVIRGGAWTRVMFYFFLYDLKNAPEGKKAHRGLLTL